MREVVKDKEGDKGVENVSVASQFRKRTVVIVKHASKHHFNYHDACPLQLSALVI